jgi:hypothetical protein
MTSPALNTMDAGDPVVGRQRISPTLVAAMMILLTLIAYWPSLSGQFVWDDAGLISESDFIKAGDGLYRFWFTTQNTDYFPVTARISCNQSVAACGQCRLALAGVEPDRRARRLAGGLVVCLASRECAISCLDQRT